MPKVVTVVANSKDGLRVAPADGDEAPGDDSDGTDGGSTGGGTDDGDGTDGAGDQPTGPSSQGLELPIPGLGEVAIETGSETLDKVLGDDSTQGQGDSIVLRADVAGTTADVSLTTGAGTPQPGDGTEPDEGDGDQTDDPTDDGSGDNPGGGDTTGGGDATSGGTTPGQDSTSTGPDTTSSDVSARTNSGDQVLPNTGGSSIWLPMLGLLMLMGGLILLRRSRQTR
ncbi:LPXTG cell wall anchor domain-containing protein [Nocardioides sp. Root140]|uniref:LPXTG cell wall anchor domain-containing protein n=1 Tax=Nocardioides sp. Root140 TaxID=1736460 RepID=UPI001F404DE5|nr:LPXTG cell wall anchor domain-containing protein [Nocardioides sp. Root140]